MIAPHPDDETAGCGGTLVLHRRAGDPVTVACITDGTGSTALRGSADERSAQRRRELENALTILGIDSLRWLALPEGRWALEQGVAALAGLIDSVRPALIYAPSRVDFHPEHRKVAQALALAFRQVSTEPLVRAYPILVPLWRPLANLEVDATRVSDEIRRALQAHRSQWGTLEPTLRRRRYTAALRRQAGLREEFWELDVERYSRLHCTISNDREGFRGLRYDPWTDPLAYFFGRSARRRLGTEA